MSKENDGDCGCLVIILLFCMFITCNNVESLNKKVDKLNSKVSEVLERKS